MLIDRNLHECKSLQNMFDSVLLEFEQKLAVALFASLDSTYGHINFGSLIWNKTLKNFPSNSKSLKYFLLWAYVLVISLNSGLTNVSVNWSGYLGSFWVHSESVVNKDKSRILLSKKRGELLEIGVGQRRLFCPSFFEEFDSKVSTTNHCQ